MDVDVFIEDYIAHYGKPGMRWGVRTTTSSKTSTDSSGKTKTTSTKSISVNSPNRKAITAGAALIGGMALKRVLPGKGSFVIGATGGAIIANAILQRSGKTTYAELQSPSDE